MSEKRVCRKCLSIDMDDPAFRQEIQEHLQNIDPDNRVDDALYKHRLSYCTECDHLVNGMCRLCGCFIELRAARKTNQCADIYPLW